MKKSPLFPLMGFLPLVMGFFYIRTAAFPLLGTLFFTALPWPCCCSSPWAIAWAGGAASSPPPPPPARQRDTHPYPP